MKNLICSNCKNYVESPRKGEFICRKDYYSNNDYGSFFKGSNCIYSPKLSNLYEERENDFPEIERLLERTKLLSEEKKVLERQCEELKERLTKIS